jgi:hypothetical protein
VVAHITRKAPQILMNVVMVVVFLSVGR